MLNTSTTLFTDESIKYTLKIALLSYVIITINNILAK